ncbi:hypothetical protein BDC45DRAFT_529980 [Circinella umbellata]|nr:hypothetical protein BDC45DRAFT_529980 [Circinella umbellata]
MVTDLQKILQERKPLQYSIKSEISKIKDFQKTMEIEQQVLVMFPKKIQIKNFTPGSSVSSGSGRKEHHEEPIINIRKDKKQYRFISVMKPSISMNKPSLGSSDQDTLMDIVEIKVNDISLTLVSESTLDYYNKNIDEQENQPLDRSLKTCLRGCRPKNSISRSEPTPALNENTPFCEHVIPLTKYWNALYQLLRFQWAEKSTDANKFIGICMPGERPMPKKLADGIGNGVLDNKERLIVESSGETDDGHTIEDTLEIVEYSIQCLKMDMFSNKLASFSTFQKPKVLGLYYVGDKLSLTSTSILNNGRYSHYVFEA